MVQFKEEILQTSSYKDYGGIITTRSEAKSLLDQSLSKEDLSVTPKYTIDHIRELIYVTATLADGTDISGFYLIADSQTHPESRHMTKIYDSVHHDHIIVSDVHNMYCLERTEPSELTADAVRTLTTPKKQSLKRVDGMHEDFEFTTYSIEIEWLLNTFDVQHESLD